MPMPDLAKPTLEAETIRRFASEQLGIALSPGEIDTLATTLNGLLDEIRQMNPIDRRAVEPETGVVVQEWPS
jgi:Asp-tRNA(Asn)/Glu-tRNA(Gln) amidotransferase C subunit